MKTFNESPEKGQEQGKQTVGPDETAELTALMNRIPNAQLIAREFQQLIKEGRMPRCKFSADPAADWLEMEAYIIRRRKQAVMNNWKVAAGLVLCLLLGLSSIYGFTMMMATSVDPGGLHKAYVSKGKKPVIG
ncbi:hypothetical protein [Chitinophaga nivalis]|uniref:Uncharacterized protein n=1 Tax=Chitinophaga nivalis TaxID=2991709 RepID=A0ABT3IQE0_9BACT|nr:hypothetical protein [Chitinophaga nivalis]MCW3464126.1 hypothetical protein [Chitinophaga nivalis]MCW3486184.1 hypothetical protein [Chitinophaga nivalis]